MRDAFYLLQKYTYASFFLLKYIWCGDKGKLATVNLSLSGYIFRPKLDVYTIHNWNKLYLPKGTDTNQSKQQNQPLYPMTLLKRKQPDNVSCTISVSIMVQIEEFRAWEEVFWLAWMFWIFPYDTASILELCFPDRAPQRCFYGWKGIIWIQID